MSKKSIKSLLPLLFIAPLTSSYAADLSSVNVSGVLQFDETIYMRDKSNDFASSANMRRAGLTFTGEPVEDFSYLVDLDFASKEQKVDVSLAFITYKGFEGQHEISIGQVPMPFCIETSTSSKWTPFLERSLAASAFNPCAGLGAGWTHWSDNYGLTLALTHPKYTVSSTTRDRASFASRLNILPWKVDKDNLLHLGFLFHYLVPNKDLQTVSYSSRPESKSRNTSKLLDTGTINSKAQSVGELEIAYQQGPWVTQAEYVRAHVNRLQESTGNVNFHGWSIMTNYVLTGESRSYDIKRGNFGQVKPKGKYGAWEVGLRYSQLDLNDKNVFGGKEENITFGLNYYINNNVKVSANYILANIKPRLQQTRRKLDTIGMRLQLTW